MVSSTCRETASDVRVFGKPQDALMRQLVAGTQQWKVDVHTCSYIILNVSYSNYIYIYIYTHTHIYTYIHTYTHTYIHIYIYTYIYTHTHTHINF